MEEEQDEVGAACIMLPFREAGGQISTSRYALDLKHPLLLSNNLGRNCCPAAVVQFFATIAPDVFQYKFDDHSIGMYLSDPANSSGSCNSVLVETCLRFRDLVNSCSSTDRSKAVKSQNTHLLVELKDCLVNLVSLGFVVDVEDFRKLLDFVCFLACYTYALIYRPGSVVKGPNTPLDRKHCPICRALLFQVTVACESHPLRACDGYCSLLPFRLEVEPTSFVVSEPEVWDVDLH